MNFNEIATVSGKPGLYKILKPTKGGVILESMDEKKSKLVVGASHRVSILAEISIYTMNEEGATPLQDVMKNIEKEFEGDLGLENGADADELRAFLKHVLPDYDESKVYPSDIKKLVAWYKIIRNNVPEALKEEDTSEEGENTAE
ncbi:hypothetical protein A33Q_4435 [Indibacter alkaliphilus LW1]|jgi:hypothetical protein|uniref:Uncharacterized protein n=1 Tax=Indibacter alkaliphilus (strain CCUG 57479 / KCTC 22604 / LW1) TaxID=1189612 RepID=S2CYW0_INDAL|nr:DUF5606 domain-containing protein [Indibacter alkaliphilus]EOZ92342.1 hypothetical protein A33Q_4435 [Indibacter alkaliphilus LW1]